MEKKDTKEAKKTEVKKSDTKKTKKKVNQKKLYLFFGIGALLLICILIGVLLLGGNKKVAISNIQQFYYRFDEGVEVNSSTAYELLCKEDTCTASIKPKGVSEDKAREYSVDTEFCEKLENLLKKYDVGSWNGFHKKNNNVLDGDFFALSVTMKNGDTIGASGYVSYPKNFKNFSKGLETLYKSLES